jgi:hypothetical protein
LSTGACASATPTWAPNEALGQTRSPEHPRDPRAGERRSRGGLEHDAVARQQRARYLAERLCERSAPGADHTDDPIGLIGDPGTLGERQPTMDLHALATEDLVAVVGDPDQRVDRGQ